jgi:hypothetical protein
MVDVDETAARAATPAVRDASQRAQDIVDDFFDLGLIIFALIWDFTGATFDAGVLAKVAVGGAGARAVTRRIFRAVLGPRIDRWVRKQNAD